MLDSWQERNPGMHEASIGGEPFDLRSTAGLVLARRDEHREATVAYAAAIIRTLDEVERLVAAMMRPGAS